MATAKTKEPKVDPHKIDLDAVYKTNGLTDRIQKLKNRVREDGVHIAGERAKYHLESYLETEGKHPAIRRELHTFHPTGMSLQHMNQPTSRKAP